MWRAERADGLYQGEAAIKLLRGDLAGAGLAKRFARKRALLGRLTHPGIARLLDAGEQDGRAFLVLEYVAGRTLSEHVRAQGLGLAERVRLLVGVARAVAHAHAQLIVHRDLKPSNVAVDDHGAPKLLDFGIAGLLGRFAEAKALREQAWARVQQVYQPTDYEYIFFNLYVYVLRFNQGRWLEAEAALKPLVEAGANAAPRYGRFVLRARQTLWSIQAWLGRPEATVAAAYRLAADMDALLGAGNSSSQRMHTDLARHLIELGDYAQAARVQAALAASLPADAASNPNQGLPRRATALLVEALAAPQRRDALLRRLGRLLEHCL
ncbi:MAG: protein kinase domain-containing protein [Roseateles sp.]